MGYHPLHTGAAEQFGRLPVEGHGAVRDVKVASQGAGAARKARGAHPVALSTEVEFVQTGAAANHTELSCLGGK